MTIFCVENDKNYNNIVFKAAKYVKRLLNLRGGFNIHCVEILPKNGEKWKNKTKSSQKNESNLVLLTSMIVKNYTPVSTYDNYE